ncbi:zinc finger, CCHC-type containing protein, partial [Tanacetum coccineum]
MVNSMLSYFGLSQGFWGEAMAVIRLSDPKLKTLGERDIEFIFVGYVKHSKAFRFYIIEPNDSVLINSIIESMDVIFDENRFSSVPRPSLMNHIGTEDIGGIRDEVSDQHSYCFNVKVNSKIFDEAMKSQDVAFWKEAINDEMDSIMGNNTWVLTDLPQSDYSSDGCEDSFLEWGTRRGADKCVYRKIDASGKGVIICLYVDDMLIFGTDQVQVDLTKEFLSSRFSMKDMGEADVILGIRIKHESNGIAISQSHYIEKVLKKFNYSNCTPVSTPLDTCEKLMPNRGLAVSQLEYSRVTVFLIYVMTCTRPDIAFVVGKLSRYTSNPGTQHWQAIQRANNTNASWISNTKDNLSTSGWVFLLGGGAISWASKKQTCIIGSTMKSEFVALAAAGKEAEWLKNLLLEIPLWGKPMTPISIRCDSANTLAKAYSQMYNRKSRHL